MTAGHISTVPTNDRAHRVTYDPDGVCHCDPQPESDAIGECPRCRRLDIRKSRA